MAARPRSIAGMLPTPPATPGVAWRPITMDDAAAVAACVRAAEIADDVPEFTNEDLTLDELGDVDLATDSVLGVVADGTVVAFGTVQRWPGATRMHRVMMWGRVHPEHRSDEIADFAVAWMAARGRQLLAGLDDGLPRHVGDSVHEHVTHWRERLERHGFAVTRWYLEMGRDLAGPLPPVTLPAGMLLEPWAADADEAVRLAHNEAFVDHWGSNPISEDRWHAWITGSRWFRPDLSVVARAGDEIAGYSLGYVYPDDVEVRGRTEAWVGQLGTRRAWRRQGVAGALLAHTMAAARDAGLDRVMLGVDAENPTGAVGVYERVGFRTERRWVYYTIEA